MANRHLARTIALQTLFEWDFRQKEQKVENVYEHIKKEFAPDFDDQGFSFDLIKKVVDKQPEIDQLIGTFAPEWPIDQITISDRNVLRIGIYELKFDNEIPPKVAINEAIELAKAFGGDSSGKFVNGVLGSIYKEMVKHGEKQNLSSQGIKELSVGGVIFRQTDEGYYFVLILDAYDKWTFPKGGIKEKESEQTTAIRELKEETGLKDLAVIDYLGEATIKVHKPEQKPYRKLIKYFLVEAKDDKLVIPDTTELKDVKWMSKEEAFKALGYKNAIDIFEEALDKLDLK